MSCNLSPSLPWPALLRARQLLAAPDVGIAFVKRGEWQCQVSTDLSWQDAEQVLMVDEDPERRAQAAQARGAVSFYQTDLHGLPRIESPNDAELESSMASAAPIRRRGLVAPAWALGWPTHPDYSYPIGGWCQDVVPSCASAPTPWRRFWRRRQRCTWW